MLLNNHSTFPIFKYVMLFQMDVLLSAWTKLHIPSSLKSTERLNSQRPWSLASISPSREHERLGASLRQRVIAQSKAPVQQNCTGVSRRNFWVRIDGNSSQHYKNHFPFASSIFTTTVSAPKPRTHSLIPPELIGHDKLPNTE